jgi:hypothetical protein
MRTGPSTRLNLLGVAALLCIMSCAQQGAPGGGLPDKKPPQISVSDPPPGQVNVPTTAVVTFRFSEWIGPHTLERNVSIYPPPARGFKVKVKGRSITIRPLPALAESTTYHVELASAVGDLHGNTIGAPHSLVFSTGPALDSGRISGCVVDPESRVAQVRVALFREDRATSDTLLFGVASYCSQTDSFGTFLLANIRPATYRLIAYADANSDGRLQPSREKVYAPISRQIVVAPGLPSQMLFPVACDTTTRRVTSCAPLAARVIAGLWSRRPPLRGARRSERSLRLEAADSSGGKPVIERYVELSGGKRFAIMLAAPLKLAPYRLVYELEPLMPVNDSTPCCDTLRLNGTTVADTALPRLTSPRVLDRVDLQPRLGLAWSKPVRLSGRVALADSLGDTVALGIDSLFSDTMRLVPDRRLRPGTTYRLRLSASAVADLSGNHPADSADTGIVVRVSTIHPDSLCIRLSGGAACFTSELQRTWLYLPFGGGTTYYCADNKGQFRFDSIPGGRGRVAWFLDRNGNHQPDNGELIPWSPPEPYVALFDTVEARPRWEIDGLQIPTCDPCERRQTPRRLGAPPPEVPPGPAGAAPVPARGGSGAGGGKRASGKP